MSNEGSPSGCLHVYPRLHLARFGQRFTLFLLFDRYLVRDFARVALFELPSSPGLCCCLP